MPLYMYRVGYTAESWAAQVQKPANREEAIRPAVRALGGKIISFYYAFGEDDVILIAQFPDNKAAAAMALAADSGGALSHITTTPLMSVSEAMTAMRQAKKAKGKYVPPAAS